jgi:hypothetical protein
MADARFGIRDIDSIPNFNNQFHVQGYDSNGNPNFKWYTNTVGNPPQMGRSTVIDAPIVPVSVDMRNADGSVRYVSIAGGVIHTCNNNNLTPDCKRLFFDVTPFVQPTLESPVFQVSSFSSSADPTQITDAIQRAEYFDTAKPDWHTLQLPSIKTTRAMVLKRGNICLCVKGRRVLLPICRSCSRSVLKRAIPERNAAISPRYSGWRYTRRGRRICRRHHDSGHFKFPVSGDLLACRQQLLRHRIP